MTIEEKRRELFERDVNIPDEVVWDYLSGKYVGKNFWLVDYAWTAFNAALDAIEIELPEGHSNMTAGALHMIARCRRSIESLNLGIKIK